MSAVATFTHNNPARKGFAITPHDTDELAAVTRGVYVGVAGNVVAVLADDSAEVTFVGCQAGSILPICAKIIKNTNTTATNLIGLY